MSLAPASVSGKYEEQSAAKERLLYLATSEFLLDCCVGCSDQDVKARRCRKSRP